jgi:hypothetical protein
MGRESRERTQGSVPDAMALYWNRACQKEGVGVAVGVCVMVAVA